MFVTDKEAPPKSEVLFSYAKMILYGFGTILAAITVAFLVNCYIQVPQQVIKLLEYFGYLGWAATLGNGAVMSWSRNTPAERLDSKILKGFSLLGVFTFVLARELVTGSI